MDTIRKILVPTDFSAHAEEAFRVARGLAKAIGAALVVFHVARPPAVATEDGRLLSDPTQKGSKDLWEDLKQITAADPSVKVQHEVIVADRHCAGHILNILEKQGCDLIVMGTHGRGWLQHLIFGSTTEEVVRKAHCPVMVVKAPAHAKATRQHESPAKAVGGPTAKS
jgi:universal stress protein A